MKYFTVLYFLCKIYSQIQFLSSSAFSFILYTRTIIHLHLPGTSLFSLSDHFMVKIKVVEITGMGKMGRWLSILSPSYIHPISILSHFSPFPHTPCHSLSPSSNLCFSYKINVTHFSSSSIEINLPFHIHLSLRILSSTMIDWQITGLTSKESSCPSYSIDLHSAFHHL